MPGRLEWVLLAYRLPREPSAPRVTLWRKLRRLGVVQVVDGLVALPADARTAEEFEWLADAVEEAGGEATVWRGRVGSAAQERALAERMAASVSADYEAVTAEALEAASLSGTLRRRTVARLRRELQRIARRDFFPPAAERDHAQQAVAALVDMVSAP